MLETSRWVLHVNNPFMQQDLTAQIHAKEDGTYDFFAVTPKGLRPFPAEMRDMLKIDGDTITADITHEQLKGMKIQVSITFGEDKAEGYFKVPIFGKMKFDGERIEIDDLPIMDESADKEGEKTETEE
ncbi:MAG: hypothetical protein IKA56_05035 [Clostridia bacterium]|nr:hypothetical protein [Clostridia bacterium]